MTANKNIYFSNTDENFSKQVYPYFMELKNDPNLFVNKSDEIYFTKEILEYIKKNNSLPFDFTSQELLYLKKHEKNIWLDYFCLDINFESFLKKKLFLIFLYVLIEPVSTCNIRCTMCFQIDKTFTKKPFMGTMSLDFFKKIIDDCSKKMGQKLSHWRLGANPTLHPKLSEMLEYVSGKFLEVELNTNATKLNEKLIRKILETGVNEIVYLMRSDEKKI